MPKFMEIVVYILVLIGLASIVKHLMHQKVEKLKTKVRGFKTKNESEKRTGSRYDSNPVNY